MISIFQQHIRNRDGKIRTAFLLFGLVLVWMAVGVNAESHKAIATAPAQFEEPAALPLDGLEFIAGIVRVTDGADMNEPLEDRLLFNDGIFSSVVCQRYNFVPAPYWSRPDGPRTHFIAELSSPTDGTMVWKGTIENGKLEGTMRWTRERWYWTVDVEHKIRGEIAVAPSLTVKN